MPAESDFHLAAVEFFDSEFLSKEEKAKVLKAWERFVRGGLKETQFTKAIYDHLIQHCSFIAHYGKVGFYNTYFTDPSITIHFLSQFDSGFGYESVEYGGDRWYTDPRYSDINRAMCLVVEECKEELYHRLTAAKREEMVASAKAALLRIGLELLFEDGEPALLRKHGPVKKE